MDMYFFLFLNFNLKNIQFLVFIHPYFPRNQRGVVIKILLCLDSNNIRTIPHQKVNIFARFKNGNSKPKRSVQKKTLVNSSLRFKNVLKPHNNKIKGDIP